MDGFAMSYTLYLNVRQYRVSASDISIHKYKVHVQLSINRPRDNLCTCFSYWTVMYTNPDKFSADNKCKQKTTN